MDEPEQLAERFEQHRSHLRGVAYRLLGSLGEADDAVQETWLRLSRADTGEVGNLGGWLTTVVSRLCLDVLRARKARREESLDAPTSERIESPASASGPEHEAELAESVGLALLVILERLAPAERIPHGGSRASGPARPRPARRLTRRRPPRAVVRDARRGARRGARQGARQGRRCDS